jgi:antitoxin MazE
MKATIIPIGNSKGIRIPKAVLEQCHIEGDVFLEIKGKYFKKMKENKDDRLIINDEVDLDMAGWEW